MKTLLFRRQIRNFRGGHLKVWDYFLHTMQSSTIAPAVFLEISEDANLEGTWQVSDLQRQDTWSPHDADALFVAGRDWNHVPRAMLESGEKPIFHLAQSSNMIRPGGIVSPFLQFEATHICVSQSIEDQLKSTPGVRGKIIRIPAGLTLPTYAAHEDTGILVIANKNTEMGTAVFDELRRHALQSPITLITQNMKRSQFIRAIQSHGYVVALPKATEGLYLPALEAMALGKIVICPDSIGNREYLNHQVNSFVPDYSVSALVQEVENACRLSPDDKARLVEAAMQTAESYSLMQERREFLTLLEEAGL